MGMKKREKKHPGMTKLQMQIAKGVAAQRAIKRKREKKSAELAFGVATASADVATTVLDGLAATASVDGAATASADEATTALDDLAATASVDRVATAGLEVVATIANGIDRPYSSLNNFAHQTEQELTKETRKLRKIKWKMPEKTPRLAKQKRPRFPPNSAWPTRSASPPPVIIPDYVSSTDSNLSSPSRTEADYPGFSVDREKAYYFHFCSHCPALFRWPWQLQDHLMGTGNSWSRKKHGLPPTSEERDPLEVPPDLHLEPIKEEPIDEHLHSPPVDSLLSITEDHLYCMPPLNYVQPRAAWHPNSPWRSVRSISGDPLCSTPLDSERSISDDCQDSLPAPLDPVQPITEDPLYCLPPDPLPHPNRSTGNQEKESMAWKHNEIKTYAAHISSPLNASQAPAPVAGQSASERVTQFVTGKKLGARVLNVEEQSKIMKLNQVKIYCAPRKEKGDRKNAFAPTATGTSISPNVPNLTNPVSASMSAPFNVPSTLPPENHLAPPMDQNTPQTDQGNNITPCTPSSRRVKVIKVNANCLKDDEIKKLYENLKDKEKKCKGMLPPAQRAALAGLKNMVDNINKKQESLKWNPSIQAMLDNIDKQTSLTWNPSIQETRTLADSTSLPSSEINSINIAGESLVTWHPSIEQTRSLTGSVMIHDDELTDSNSEIDSINISGNLPLKLRLAR